MPRRSGRSRATAKRRAFETRSYRAGGQGGVPRVHIINGREHEGLLAEVFSHQGIGTLAQRRVPGDPARASATFASFTSRSAPAYWWTNGPHAAGRARTNDPGLFCLRGRSQPGRVHGSAPLPSTKRVELACLFVAERFANQGIGGKLVQYAEGAARGGGGGTFLPVHAGVQFFLQKGGFRLGTPDDLPPERRRTLRPQRPEVAGTRQTSHPDCRRRLVTDVAAVPAKRQSTSSATRPTLRARSAGPIVIPVHSYRRTHPCQSSITVPARKAVAADFARYLDTWFPGITPAADAADRLAELVESIADNHVVFAEDLPRNRWRLGCIAAVVRRPTR